MDKESYIYMYSGVGGIYGEYQQVGASWPDQLIIYRHLSSSTCGPTPVGDNITILWSPGRMFEKGEG
jgi:hypothetical protein